MKWKRWAPRAAWGAYGLLLLVATARAWLKFDGEMAGKVLGFGLVLGVVLWRAWRYGKAILSGGRSQFSSINLERPSAASRKNGARRDA